MEERKKNKQNSQILETFFFQLCERQIFVQEPSAPLAASEGGFAMGRSSREEREGVEKREGILQRRERAGTTFPFHLGWISFASSLQREPRCRQGSGGGEQRVFRGFSVSFQPKQHSASYFQPLPALQPFEPAKLFCPLFFYLFAVFCLVCKPGPATVCRPGFQKWPLDHFANFLSPGSFEASVWWRFLAVCKQSTTPSGQPGQWEGLLRFDR